MLYVLADPGPGNIGAANVESAIEFRENADECLGWAETARTVRERENFLRMAQSWLDAAAYLEESAVTKEPELT